MSKLLAFVTLSMLLQYATAVAVYGQCGGQGYTGSTTCDSGSTCVYSNPYYSQCLPSSATTTSNPSTTSSAPPTSTGGSGNASGLNAKFITHGKKFFGTCADQPDFSNTQLANVIKTQFGALTPGNSMKWDATEPSQNQFSYSRADYLVNWAVSNGKLIRGHTLVWHNQLPSWVQGITNPSTLTSVIQNHIANVAGHFKGKLYCDEILAEDGTLASQIFYNVLGESFVAIAFKAARAADPSAKLYINDYNLDSNNKKVQGMIALVKRTNQNNGQIIDGIGTQMHLGAGGAGGAQAAITALATAGVDVAITELDIAGAAPTDYTNVVKACLSTAKCVSITTWGVDDGNTWRPGTNPLLFDANFNPKPAETAILALL